MTDKTELMPCPWCGVGMELRPINMPWSDGEPCWSIWHADMEEAIRRKCPMEMGGYGTEAEAIAAWNARADYHGYEQAAIEAWKSIKSWNTRAENGTLTAEQVREAVMSADRWEKPMGNTGLTNTHLIIRDDGWQAIADELNGLGKE